MEIIKDYWAVIVGLVGLVVWSVRLEAGMKMTRQSQDRDRAQFAKDIERIEGQLTRDYDRIDSKLDQIIVALGKKEDRR